MTHLNDLPFTENNLRDTMIASAIAGGIYSPAGQGLPKKTGTHDALTVALKKTAPTRNKVLSITRDLGKITSPELAQLMGITSQHAGYHLKNLRQSGFIHVVNKKKAACGNKLFVYALKSLGKNLLKALDEKEML